MIEKISIKYYLLSVILPIICIFFIFGYATKYINNEIHVLKHELIGLKKANDIHSIIIHLQRLRGIINMPNTSKKYALEKKQYIYETTNKINTLRDRLEPSNKEHLAHHSIYIYLSSILQLFKEQHNFTKEENFQNYTKINENSFIIQKDISLYSSLLLDPEKNSYLLMETIIIQLPKLIEYNGQLRALLTARGDKTISKSEFIDLSNRMSIIIGLSNDLNYNMNKIYKLNKNKLYELTKQYTNTVKSKDNLLQYINSNFKEHLKLSDPEKIYEFFTKNINSMIELYNLNSEILEQRLKQRLKNKINISNLTITFGILCIIFILYNFFNYYRKNNDLIITINNSNKKLQEQSISDGLTKLYNRRYFDITFEQQLSQANREKSSFVFIMCDIDYFKKYNDTYGHSKGDETLVKVADTIKNSLKRPTDFAFRIGGEEFGILLSNMTFEKAKCFAKTIKYNIELLNIPHVGNEENKTLTMSMGIAYVNTQNSIHTIDEIYNCADNALYKAKENGRNQITSCELI